jgi:hypothetical protein
MESKTRVFDSLVFGPTRDPMPSEEVAIAKSVADTPVAVFQALNKMLNARGMRICILTVDEPDVPRMVDPEATI